MTELRPYQNDVVGEFERTVAAGHKRIILVAPTGSGKTVIAAEIINRAVAQHQRVLVLSHRREIVKHTGGKLHAHGVRHGIIQAGLEELLRPLEAVQVASIQTLHARAIRSDANRQRTCWLSTNAIIAPLIPIPKSSKAIRKLSY